MTTSAMTIAPKTLVRQCSNCTEMINPKRLMALPNTRFCIKCQEQAEAEMPKTDPKPDAYLNRMSQVPKDREAGVGACVSPRNRRIKAATFGLAHHITHYGHARAAVAGA